MLGYRVPGTRNECFPEKKSFFSTWILIQLQRNVFLLLFKKTDYFAYM